MANILVVGGYGLIGLEITRRLIGEGHSVVGLGRDVRQARVVEPRCRWVEADLAELEEVEDWFPFLKDIDVVINASGALQSGQKDNLHLVQRRAITALISAADGLEPEPKFVQISAPGAGSTAKLEFLSTKGDADDFLRDSALTWFIVKPGLVIAPTAYGGTALLRMLASVPFVLPLVHPKSLVGTVHIDDVVDVVCAAIDGTIPPNTEVSVIEDNPKPLEEVVAGFRQWLGIAPPKFVLRLPTAFGEFVGRCGDFLGNLGWRSPLRSTSLEVMAGGVLADSSEYKRVMGKSCRSFEDTLRALPSTVQERWFARLFLLFPVILAMLSVFWLASGVIGIVSLGEAAAHMEAAGFGTVVSMLIVILGGLVDIGLGLAVLYRPTARLALWGMVIVTLTYLTAGTLLSPALWLDPLGPYVKTLPAALLAVVAASLIRTR